MEYSETITGAIGYRGDIPIGRGHYFQGKWSVEIYHKAAAIKADSRRGVRLLLAVHGADRVEMIHRVNALWPAGISPPWAAYLPAGSPLLASLRSEPRMFKSQFGQKNFSDPDPWHGRWISSFSSTENPAES